MIKRILTTLTFISMCFMSMPQPASATNLFTNLDCSKAGSSALCNRGNSNDSPLTGCPGKCGSGLIPSIANIVAYAAGAGAVILILIGSVKLITSGSDTSKGGRVDEDVINARRSIVNALVGLAIIVLARTLVVFIIDKLHKGG